MMIMARRGVALDLVFEIGNFGVGAFKLVRYGPGAASSLIGEQRTPPYQDTASFSVQVPPAGGAAGAVGFALQVLGMSQTSSAKLPLLISGIQNGGILPLLGPDNNVVNGPVAPFSSHVVALLTPGIAKQTTFLVYFQ